MFDKETVNAYKNINSPDKMKENILHMYGKHKKPSIYSLLKPMAGIAACFLVVVTAAALYFGNNTPLSITNYGEKVSKAPMAVVFEDVPYSPNTRLISMFHIENPVLSCIPLNIDTDRETEISVSGGILLSYNDELDNVFYAGESYVIDSSSLVYWSIDGFSERDVLTLHLTTNGNTISLSLTYDKNSEAWMLAYIND